MNLKISISLHFTLVYDIVTSASFSIHLLPSIKLQTFVIPNSCIQRCLFTNLLPERKTPNAWSYRQTVESTWLTWNYPSIPSSFRIRSLAKIKQESYQLIKYLGRRTGPMRWIVQSRIPSSPPGLGVGGWARWQPQYWKYRHLPPWNLEDREPDIPVLSLQSLCITVGLELPNI